MNKTPVITITCNRDLPLLELQAQSIALYLDKGTPVYIIVNEADTTKWFKEFDNKTKKEKEVCKTIKVHKKLEGTEIPPKK